MGTAMAIAAIAAVVMVALQAPRSVPDAGQPEPSDAADGVMGSGPIAPSPSASAERRGLRVVLDAAQPCWVRVVADGAIVEEITLAPGDIVAYRAKRDLELRLGNAGGVTVRINGERVEAGTAGEVVVLDVAWQRGEVLIERG